MLFQLGAIVITPETGYFFKLTGPDKTVAASAKEAGVARVYWHTHETNATARRLYDLVVQIEAPTSVASGLL